VPGGVEAILGEHARLLRAAGHDVAVVSGRGDGVVRVPEVDSRHPEVEALYAALGRGDKVARAFADLQLRLRAALEPVLRDRDVVVAHNVLTMPFNLPLAAALVELGRLVAWTHDAAWVNPRYQHWQRPGPPYDLMRTAQPGVRYVAISEVRRAELLTLGIDSEVVPNGIDEDAFLGIEPATRALLDQAGASGGDPLILVPLRITRRKRLEVALTAAARLRERHPNLRVVVTGPLGPHSADNLELWQTLSQLRARLRLDGVVAFLHEQAVEGRHPVTAANIAQLYRAADVVLMPSESEGFGLPVIEAALARAPIVCGDIPVLREVGGEHLHCFPAAGTDADIAAAVEEALGDPLAADRREVRRRSSWKSLLPRIEAALEPAGDA
jgi:glycosyltransferase involved in cell wall biosynthesis